MRNSVLTPTIKEMSNLAPKVHSPIISMNMNEKMLFSQDSNRLQNQSVSHSTQYGNCNKHPIFNGKASHSPIMLQRINKKQLHDDIFERTLIKNFPNA